MQIRLQPGEAQPHATVGCRCCKVNRSAQQKQENGSVFFLFSLFRMPTYILRWPERSSATFRATFHTGQRPSTGRVQICCTRCAGPVHGMCRIAARTVQQACTRSGRAEQEGRIPLSGTPDVPIRTGGSTLRDRRRGFPTGQKNAGQTSIDVCPALLYSFVRERFTICRQAFLRLRNDRTLAINSQSAADRSWSSR